MFYQDGDSPVSLALKRTLEEARFAWVLDFLNLLTVCYNKFVPVVSTSSVSLCVVALIFFILKFQLLFRVNFLYEGDIGVCGIAVLANFMRYFGNFNLELRYCGILQTCGMRFLYVLVDDFRYKNVSFTF